MPPTAPEWECHPLLLNGSAQPDKSRDASGSRAGIGRPDGRKCAQLSVTAGWLPSPGPSSLLAEMSLSCLRDGLAVLRISQAGYSSTVPCCHGYSHLPRVVTSVSPKGRELYLMHMHVLGRGLAHLTSYSILVENE